VLSLILVALFGVFVSFVFSKKIYDLEVNRVIFNFHKEVDSKSLSLEKEFNLTLESLQSLKVLFDYGINADEVMFRDVANSIYVRHKNIQALEWIPKVIHERRYDYINKRRESYPDFTITQRENLGIVERIFDSDVYFPVYYVEPMAGNEAAFGFDLSSNVKRLNALNKSRDTGRMVLTESIRLVQEKASQKAVLSFLPVYKNTPTTLVQRKDSLLGFVLGVFRVGDIYNSALSDTAEDDIEYLLIDKSNGVDDVLHQQFSGVKDTSLLKEMRYEKQIDNMLGRRWYLAATPTDRYIEHSLGLLPYFVFISGVLFSVFGAFLFQIIAYRALIVEREKYKIYLAMVGASQHVLNNFINQMQLFRIGAERTEGFDRKLIKLYDDVIDEATDQVKELSNVKQLDDKSIAASVYPKDL